MNESNIAHGYVYVARLATELDGLTTSAQEAVIRHFFEKLMDDNNGQAIKYARDHANELMEKAGDFDCEVCLKDCSILYPGEDGLERCFSCHQKKYNS